MKNVVTVDSSVFLSGLFKNEINHDISLNFLNILRKHKIQIIIPMIVYFEVLHNYYRVSKNIKETDEVSEEFILLNQIKLLKILNMEASSLAQFVAEHHDFDLKTSDTMVALCAMSSNIPLITWDKKLIKHCDKKVQAFTPKEFLAKLATH